MKTFVLTKPSTSGKQYISVTEAEWNSGFKVNEKRGMIEIEPGNDEANNAKLAALQSGRIQANFGNQNRQTGLYDITLVFITATAPAAPVAAGSTLETQA